VTSQKDGDVMGGGAFGAAVLLGAHPLTEPLHGALGVAHYHRRFLLVTGVQIYLLTSL